MLKSYSLQIIGIEREEIHSWVIEKCSVKSYQKMSPNETDIYLCTRDPQTVKYLKPGKKFSMTYLS